MLQRTRQSTWGHEQSWRSGKMETIPGQPGRTGVYIPVLWHWTESCIKWWCWKGQTWGVHYIFPSTKTFEAQAEPMGKKKRLHNKSWKDDGEKANDLSTSLHLSVNPPLFSHRFLDPGPGLSPEHVFLEASVVGGRPSSPQPSPIRSQPAPLEDFKGPLQSWESGPRKRNLSNTLLLQWI